MPRNIEIKARISNVEELTTRAAALADSGPTELYQEDTFFSCPKGRMKLRVFTAHKGELIYYERPDCLGPKESFYVTAPTSSPGLLRDVLTRAYGMVGRVQKRRTVFLAGRTRIHLDRVEGLGDFLELEVVLAPGESVDAGKAVAQDLLHTLGVSGNQLVAGAYVDLLSHAAREPSV